MIISKLALLLPENIHKQYNIYGREESKSNLIHFLESVDIPTLKDKKDFFILHKDTPEFQGLLFYADSKKIKLLLEWGYNPNVQLKDTPYQKYLTRLSPETTPLHKVVEINSVKSLMAYGAKHDAKAHLHPVERLFLKDSGITKIRTLEHIKHYLRFIHRNKNVYTTSDNYKNIISSLELLIAFNKGYPPSHTIKNNTMIASVNNWLANCNQDETALERAESLKQKSKYLFLKTFCNPIDIAQFEEKEYKDLLLLANPIMALSNAMKKDNHYLFNRLNTEHLKHLNPQKRNLAFYAVSNNCGQWLHKMLDSKLCDINYKDKFKQSLLHFAYDQNRPTMFEIIYNKPNLDNSLIEEVVTNIQKNMAHFKSNGYTDKTIMEILPTTIIHFLVNQGHYFENKTLVEEIIKFEKDKLNNIMVVEPEPKKKSFKI